MTIDIELDQKYLIATLEALVHTPSPTGYAERGIAMIERELETLGFSSARTRKGACILTLTGRENGPGRGLTAHVDTLGGMVKEIKPNGRLRLTKIGGYAWNTVEGEGCRIFTSSGAEIRGSLLCVKASAHVHGKDVAESKRDDADMEVRLDALITNAEDAHALGIAVGDYVAFDPRAEFSPAGFFRSRHLDDKAGVACLLAALKALSSAGVRPTVQTTIHFSNYEEVGHGAASGFPDNLGELVAVDMAAVGEGQASDEFHVTVCVKDSGGPYSHALSCRLRSLAEENSIPMKVDIYPYYGSDAEAFWRAGGDVEIALIGPGIDASHNYERTHVEALLATTQLVLAYILS